MGLAVRPPSLDSADFQRALGTRPVARTAHFSLHVLPQSHSAAAAAPLSRKLSTPAATSQSSAVDEPGEAHLDMGARPGWRLGLVLPKKQARRSVTRSLMRHQAREAFRRHAPRVQAAGRHGPEVDGWVLRLRAPFDRQAYPSAASAALSLAVRQELDELWQKVLGPRA